LKEESKPRIRRGRQTRLEQIIFAREMLKSILHPFMSLFIKLIDFNEKVISNVTSKITFLLKSIYLIKREDERG
jgi:hypothetical protein